MKLIRVDGWWVVGGGGCWWVGGGGCLWVGGGGLVGYRRSYRQSILDFVYVDLVMLLLPYSDSVHMYSTISASYSFDWLKYNSVPTTLLLCFVVFLHDILICRL